MEQSLLALLLSAQLVHVYSLHLSPLESDQFNLHGAQTNQSLPKHTAVHSTLDVSHDSSSVSIQPASVATDASSDSDNIAAASQSLLPPATGVCSLKAGRPSAYKRLCAAAVTAPKCAAVARTCDWTPILPDPDSLGVGVRSDHSGLTTAVTTPPSPPLPSQNGHNTKPGIHGHSSLQNPAIPRHTMTPPTAAPTVTNSDWIPGIFDNINPAVNVLHGAAICGLCSCGLCVLCVMRFRSRQYQKVSGFGHEVEGSNLADDCEYNWVGRGFKAEAQDYSNENDIFSSMLDADDPEAVEAQLLM